MAKIALLLVNTGSPSAPTPEAIAAYLSQFLSDRHIVDLPAFFWKPLLHHVIIPRRKKISAQRYASVWTPTGSPLVVNMQEITTQLQDRLGGEFVVAMAMRYGSPSIEDALDAVLAQRPDRLLLMPMFAQEAGETRGSVKEAFFDAIKQKGLSIPVQIVAPWFEHPAYIHALAERICASNLDFSKTRLIASFHGIPIRNSAEYVRECRRTTELLESELGLENGACRTVFQSKFGFGRWTEPSLKDVLLQEATQGTRSVAVFCPGFSADCLESIEEVAVKYRAIFLEAGGAEFTYISALNAGKSALALYERIVCEAIRG